MEPFDDPLWTLYRSFECRILSLEIEYGGRASIILSGKSRSGAREDASKSHKSRKVIFANVACGE